MTPEERAAAVVEARFNCEVQASSLWLEDIAADILVAKEESITKERDAAIARAEAAEDKYDSVRAKLIIRDADVFDAQSRAEAAEKERDALRKAWSKANAAGRELKVIGLRREFRAMAYRTALLAANRRRHEARIKKEAAAKEQP
jgi:hypothetical protein